MIKLSSPLSAVLVAACLLSATIARAENSAPLSCAGKRLIRVPLSRQATDYTCGASALQSVLGYYGENVREAALAKQLRSNYEAGTRYQDIARIAKKRGYSVSIIRNAKLENLKALLDKGIPAICLIQAWPERHVNYKDDWDDGHYVVAIGYDENNVYFMDPCTLGNYTFIPTSEFLDRWHDRTTGERLVHFIMTVTKPKPAFDPEAIVKME